MNCDLSVISVTDIADFALMPSSCLSYSSGFLTPEINFPRLAAVFRSHNSVLLSDVLGSRRLTPLHLVLRTEI